MSSEKRYWFVLVAIGIQACFATAIAQQDFGRTRESFDFGWLFHKGDIAIRRAVKAGKQGGLTDANAKVVTGEETVIAYTDKNKVIPFKRSDWKDVRLPHDWLVEEPFTHDDEIGSTPAANGYLKPGIGFYRKEFTMPGTDKGKNISIEFDGIFRNSSVWVNGHFMGSHASGYTPSHYELADVLRYGSEGTNVMLVKVDATEYEGWWYEGCGIYRHVWLLKTGKLHVGRFGAFVTTPQINAEQATVNVKTTLQNESGMPRRVTLISRLVNAANQTVDSVTVNVDVSGFF